MPAKVTVSRTDHTPGHLRELASKRRFRDRRHRLRAIAPVMEDGLSRAGVASGAGVGARTLRDRVVRYSADGLDGLRDAARPGAPPKLESGQAGEGQDPISVNLFFAANFDTFQCPERQSTGGSSADPAGFFPFAGHWSQWDGGLHFIQPLSQEQVNAYGAGPRRGRAVAPGCRGHPGGRPSPLRGGVRAGGRGWGGRACCRGSGRGKGRARAS